MSDDYQIDIPPSFFALYTDARKRLSEPIGVVRQRYEVCEDLAQLLVQQAQHLHHVEVPSEEQILLGIHAGLTAGATADPADPADAAGAEAAAVSPAEAGWVVRRLAELLDWPCPLPALPPNPPPA